MLGISSTPNNFIRSRKFIMLSSNYKRSRSAPFQIPQHDEKMNLKDIREIHLGKIRYQLSQVFTKECGKMEKRNMSVELTPHTLIAIKPCLNTANSTKTKIINQSFDNHKASKMQNLRSQLSIMKSSIARPFIRPSFKSKQKNCNNEAKDTSKQLPPICLVRKLRTKTNQINPQFELQPWDSTNQIGFQL